jgi:hypothetical protein
MTGRWTGGSWRLTGARIRSTWNTALREEAKDPPATPAGRFHLLEWALQQEGAPPVRFLREDESYTICGDIECGIHGHLGPNGRRGTVTAFRRMGRRANIGHLHSAQVREGVYVSGVMAQQMDYTRGPSSWSPSLTVTYQNSMRAMLTCWAGRPWA